MRCIKASGCQSRSISSPGVGKIYQARCISLISQLGHLCRIRQSWGKGQIAQNTCACNNGKKSSRVHQGSHMKRPGADSYLYKENIEKGCRCNVGREVITPEQLPIYSITELTDSEETFLYLGGKPQKHTQKK